MVKQKITVVRHSIDGTFVERFTINAIQYPMQLLPLEYQQCGVRFVIFYDQHLNQLHLVEVFTGISQHFYFKESKKYTQEDLDIFTEYIKTLSPDEWRNYVKEGILRFGFSDSKYYLEATRSQLYNLTVEEVLNNAITELGLYVSSSDLHTIMESLKREGYTLMKIIYPDNNLVETN
jgi:hypothetical protein